MSAYFIPGFIKASVSLSPHRKIAKIQSIKEDVLTKFEAHMPEIRERFCIEDLSLFGSVTRGEDTPDSDMIISIHISPERQHSNTLKTFRHT
ncbi:MAG TPA: hypothetical protein O0X42_01545 [Methanocorpusculum sp.]|nr:hypothetical protein [Methanocorpusculum sp.]